MVCAKGSDKLRTTGELDARSRGKLGEEADSEGRQLHIRMAQNQLNS